MKRYLEFIKEAIFYDNLDDSELEDRLKDLIRDRDEISEEIDNINRIIRERENNTIQKIADTFPKNIFDLNKEQLEFIFERTNSLNEIKHNISNKYFHQLNGVYPAGYNGQTEQFYFNIRTSDNFDISETKFELDRNVIKSIKFLGDNLKHINDYVEFGVSYFYSDDNDIIKYYSDSNIKTKYKTYSSIEDVLKALVEDDLEYQ